MGGYSYIVMTEIPSVYVRRSSMHFKAIVVGVKGCCDEDVSTGDGHQGALPPRVAV